ncbi:hypothetical protein RIF29_07197 [Crotalaria pallida]|uniref:Uncharacterized protein n=1 Tax=Crotalaria pallida TaxID=3830 RepID=A0AAN9J530_CROPI
MTMMNVSVDSPLVLNYSTFRFISLLINNLCTWLAASLSFWKTRSPKPELLQLPDCTRVFDQPDPVPQVLEPDDSVNDDVDGVRKGKFTVYYEDDVECCGNDDVLGVGEMKKWGENQREGIRIRSNGGCELEWRESLLRLRMGECERGWYTRQDLTVFNGNVVKLWDAHEFKLRFGGESRSKLSCVHLCY